MKGSSCDYVTVNSCLVEHARPKSPLFYIAFSRRPFPLVFLSLYGWQEARLGTVGTVLDRLTMPPNPNPRNGCNGGWSHENSEPEPESFVALEERLRLFLGGAPMDTALLGSSAAVHFTDAVAHPTYAAHPAQTGPEGSLATCFDQSTYTTAMQTSGTGVDGQLMIAGPSTLADRQLQALSCLALLDSVMETVTRQSGSADAEGRTEDVKDRTDRLELYSDLSLGLSALLGERTRTPRQFTITGNARRWGKQSFRDQETEQFKPNWTALQQALQFTFLSQRPVSEIYPFTDPDETAIWDILAKEQEKLALFLAALQTRKI